MPRPSRYATCPVETGAAPTPTSSAGHAPAGPTIHAELTLRPDHSMGAGHLYLRDHGAAGHRASACRCRSAGAAPFCSAPSSAGDRAAVSQRADRRSGRPSRPPNVPACLPPIGPIGASSALSLLSSSRSGSGPPRFSSAWSGSVLGGSGGQRGCRLGSQLTGRLAASVLVRRFVALQLFLAALLVTILGFLVYWGVGWPVVAVVGLFVLGLGIAPCTHSPSASRSRRWAHGCAPRALASCWRWACRSCRCRPCSRPGRRGRPRFGSPTVPGLADNRTRLPGHRQAVAAQKRRRDAIGGAAGLSGSVQDGTPAALEIGLEAVTRERCAEICHHFDRTADLPWRGFDGWW